LVPINAVGQRLDTYMTPPTDTQWRKFEARNKMKKLCTDYHLGHSCQREICKFDHGQVDVDEYYCLRFVRHESPCAKRGRCRRLDCYDGHVCQKYACAKGRAKSCKMVAEMHNMVCEVTHWVKPDAGKEFTREPANSSSGSVEQLMMPEGDLIML
jgi:hypothetical protein